MGPERGPVESVDVFRRFAAIAAATLLLAGCAPTPNPATPVEGSTVYVLGDSWSTGYSADPGEGWTDLLAAEHDWEVIVDATPGAGYVATLAGGDPFPARVDAMPDTPPDLVIVAGGLNDEWDGSDKVGAAAEATYEALHEKYPGVDVVAVGPSAWPVSGTLRSIDTQLRTATAEAGVRYVSPIEDGWMTGGNVAEFIDPATNHPSNHGHELYAEKLSDALTR